MYIKSQLGSCKSVVKVLEKDFTRQWPSREAIKFYCCSAGTEWRSCKILLLKAVGELYSKSSGL